MRVDGETDVGGVAAHFDGQRGFADEVAGMAADDAGTEQTTAVFVEDQFGEALFGLAG